MSLDDLYREVILDHYRNPRHRGRLDHATGHAEGQNPLCGDEVSLDLVVEDGRVTEVAVTGQGCSISQASASMMADIVIGKTIEEIAEISRRFRAMMDLDEGDPGIDASRPGEALGDLEALQGVRRFPVRIKCANLPWATLQEALQGPA
ncbi:MAG: SUF system NifU family Fe-S cluster assembly protein [Actinobacteria bacterium]|nr:SUF system NifU family Fe-S cluster assembly protein [Actinomycetota bacterium]MBU1493272.1 SUF system NifU family Fe-S cluster assembly protein [Actinomycetota bacterium]